jgi:hypothetical protein
VIDLEKFVMTKPTSQVDEQWYRLQDGLFQSQSKQNRMESLICLPQYSQIIKRVWKRVPRPRG